jgi:uncharacterized protein YdeI (YjbR/CyaY-like superfamily)
MLIRPIHQMPDFVRKALVDHDLMDAYHARPPYQQNDYLGWIARSKQETTKRKRLNQMINELKTGKSYMKMSWKPQNQAF